MGFDLEIPNEYTETKGFYWHLLVNQGILLAFFLSVLGYHELLVWSHSDTLKKTGHINQKISCDSME